MKVTVLGSGTSMGVPTLACRCSVCRSADPRDQRTRPSVLLSYNGRNVVIDTTPDFRLQALRSEIDHLDAILYTHAHADHILGLDDIRPFNQKQRSAIPVYASDETIAILRRTFAYIFEPQTAESSVPQIEIHAIKEPFNLFGAHITPVPVRHGPLTVLGFRIGTIAYLTDFSSIPETSGPMLGGLDHLILDALRYTPHPMHSTVDQSLAIVRELAPRHAWFTHICHDLGHEATNAKLPQNVQLSYDGLSFEVDL
ncbi:MAG TPA: MBL fold metallo-hydrolase [Candidatus Acidoferrales bacterium]|nr:MBL fold metallo-hydrolase [Candidatus Acidoferrales bacterium]